MSFRTISNEQIRTHLVNIYNETPISSPVWDKDVLHYLTVEKLIDNRLYETHRRTYVYPLYLTLKSYGWLYENDKMFDLTWKPYGGGNICSFLTGDVGFVILECGGAYTLQVPGELAGKLLNIDCGSFSEGKRIAMEYLPKTINDAEALMTPFNWYKIEPVRFNNLQEILK